MRYGGLRTCRGVVDAMRDFTRRRAGDVRDEIWLVEHEPVFTLGQAAKRRHLLAPGDIPILQLDRGGQVTYHGPGQLVVYVLLDLHRLGLGIRRLVSALEQSVIDTLAEGAIRASRKAAAPGVYVAEKKIASLGLRVRRGCSYHGLALNVDMDLAPFRRINPCGYAGLEVTQLADLGVPWDVGETGERLLGHLVHALGYPQAAGFETAPWPVSPPARARAATELE